MTPCYLFFSQNTGRVTDIISRTQAFNMFLEKFEERNLTFPFNTVGKDIFSRFLNELKSGKVIVPEKTVEYQP